MQSIFDAVMNALDLLAATTGLSYRAINIVVYFFVIPLGFAALVDAIWKRHVFKLGVGAAIAAVVLGVPDFERFSSGLFELCVGLLESFGFLGWDYSVASVVICVFIPGALFALLGALLLTRRRRDRSNRPGETKGAGGEAM